MAKVKKSYYLEEREAFELKAMSEGLGVSQTDIIRLALQSFMEFGVSEALYEKKDSALIDPGYDGFSKLIYRASRGDGIMYEVKSQMRVC